MNFLKLFCIDAILKLDNFLSKYYNNRNEYDKYFDDLYNSYLAIEKIINEELY